MSGQGAAGPGAPTGKAASGKRSAASSCSAAWRIVPTPRVVGGGELYGVAASSPTDVWAVGTLDFYSARPLIEHWDGSRWKTLTIGDAPRHDPSRSVACLVREAYEVGLLGPNEGTLVDSE